MVEKNGEWWDGELNGERGFFPSSYVEALPDDEVPDKNSTEPEETIAESVEEKPSDSVEPVESTEPQNDASEDNTFSEDNSSSGIYDHQMY